MTTPYPPYDNKPTTVTEKTVSTPGIPSTSKTTYTTTQPTSKTWVWWTLLGVLIFGGSGWYLYDHNNTVQTKVDAAGTDVKKDL